MKLIVHTFTVVIIAQSVAALLYVLCLLTSHNCGRKVQTQLVFGTTLTVRGPELNLCGSLTEEGRRQRRLGVVSVDWMVAASRC